MIVIRLYKYKIDIVSLLQCYFLVCIIVTVVHFAYFRKSLIDFVVPIKLTTASTSMGAALSVFRHEVEETVLCLFPFESARRMTGNINLKFI